jgi:hypothetical protein
MQQGDWNIRSACSVLHHDAPPQNGWWQDLELSRGQLELHVELEETAIIPVPQYLTDNVQSDWGPNPAKLTADLAK